MNRDRSAGHRWRRKAIALMLIKQNDFFRPGRYYIGAATHEFGPKRIGRIVANTQRMLADGIQIPAYSYHTPPGDPKAGPTRPNGQIDATAGAGWVRNLTADDKGRLSHESEVTDEAVVGKIKEKAIRHVSAEFGRYVDPLTGKDYGECVRHIAFTQKPRVQHQGEISLAMSDVPDGGIVIDAEAVAQFAFGPDADPPANPTPPLDAGDPVTPVEPVVPDPANSGPSDLDFMTAKRINQDLEAVGIVSPLCDPAKDFSGWMKELSAVVRQFVRSKAAADAAEQQEHAAGDPDQELEEQPPRIAQWSEQDPEYWREQAESAENDVHKKACLQFAETIERQREDRIINSRLTVKHAIRANRLPPGLQRELEARIGSLQFSEDGADEPSMTVTEVAELYSRFVPDSLRFGEDPEEDDDDVEELDHPDGEQFAETDGPSGRRQPVSAAEAVAIATDIRTARYRE